MRRCVRHGGEHAGPGLEQRRMALLRLQPGHDAHDRRPRRDVVLALERAADLGGLVAGEVDAVVDQADRRADTALVLELSDDRPRDGDEVVHPGREAADEVAVHVGANPGRVDRPDHQRPAPARGRELPCGLRAHDLGAVHVVVDHVGLDGCEVGRDRVDRLLVGHVVEDTDRHARLLDPPDAGATRERQHGHVVARSVDPADDVGDVLLRAAAGPGGKQLDHAQLRSPGGQREPGDRLEAGIDDQPGRGQAEVAVTRAAPGSAGWARRGRPTRTCTARRRASGRPCTCPARSRAGPGARGARRRARSRASGSMPAL